jgi:hypothetical protein
MRLYVSSIGAELRRPRRLLQLACPRRHISSPGPQSVKSLLYPQESSADGSRHTVHGYIRSVRKQKNIAFAALGDGSTLDPLQVVLTPDQAQQYVDSHIKKFGHSDVLLVFQLALPSPSLESLKNALQEQSNLTIW